MGLIERLEAAGTSILLMVIAATMSAVGWLVRRVLTNQAQIVRLEETLRHRDVQRTAADQRLVDTFAKWDQQRRDDQADVRADIKEIRADLRLRPHNLDQ
jgi:hypothetical protein